MAAEGAGRIGGHGFHTGYITNNDGIRVRDSRKPGGRQYSQPHAPASSKSGANASWFNVIQPQALTAGAAAAMGSTLHTGL